MTKNEFLAIMSQQLTCLPQADINKALEYYSEMIDDRIEDGESEEAAVASVGSPYDMARQVLLDTPLPRLVAAKAKPSHTLRAWEIVLLVLGSPVWVPLLLALIIVVASVFFSIWSVIVSLYIADLSIGLSSVVALASVGAAFVSGSGVQAAFNLSGALICFGLCILMFFLINALAKLALKLGKVMLRGIKSAFVVKR